MKIEMHQVGYSHPSAANWSYHVWNLYSDNGTSAQVKETFGGDYRLKEKLLAAGHTVEIFKSYEVGKFGVRETEKLRDIESDEIYQLLTREV